MTLGGLVGDVEFEGEIGKILRRGNRTGFIVRIGSLAGAPEIDDLARIGGICWSDVVKVQVVDSPLPSPFPPSVNIPKALCTTVNGNDALAWPFRRP